MKLDRRTWMCSAALSCGAPLVGRDGAGQEPRGRRGTHPHAALFLYTRPLLAARHAKLVGDALRRRAAAHTSGWRIGADGKPVIATGPVASRAGVWHGDKLSRVVGRAWPFVAVLEYDGQGEPEAWLDCFRRVRGSKTKDGWLLDPGVGYAAHMNAQMVTAQDADHHYLAMPDTPTDGYLGGHEFVVRARVRWADGRSARTGWWFWFEASPRKKVDDWFCDRTPLVDWRPDEVSSTLGARAIRPLDDPTRELAVRGTRIVLGLARVPAGVTPGR